MARLSRQCAGQQNEASSQPTLRNWVKAKGDWYKHYRYGLIQTEVPTKHTKHTKGMPRNGMADLEVLGPGANYSRLPD